MAIGGVLARDTTGLVTQTGPGSAGEVLTSNGAGAVPTFQTAPSGAVVVDPAGALDGDGTGGSPLAVRVDGVTITINGSNELEASTGGGGTVTNTGTLTDHGVIVGNGGVDVSALALATDIAQVLHGGVSADPIWNMPETPIVLSVDAEVDTGNCWVVSESLEIASGKVLTIDGGARVEITGAAGIHGLELDYVEYTSNVSVTASTEGTANTIVSGNTVAYSGSMTVLIEFFSVAAINPSSAGANLQFVLYEDGASIGILGQEQNPAASGHRGPIFVVRRMTPSNASHTYSIRAFTSTGTATIVAGTGGVGNALPGYVRIILV